MRARITWIQWVLLSGIGAAVGIPIGFAVAYAVIWVMGSILFIVGVLLGVVVGSVIGGAVAGAVIGIIQIRLLANSGVVARSWVLTSALGWTTIAIFVQGASLAIASGDLSPLLWLVVLGALMGGIVQWLAFRSRIQHVGRRVIMGTLGTIAGSVAGVAFLAALTDRGPLDPFVGVLTMREPIKAASVTGLTVHNGSLFFFVIIENLEAYADRWELWKSDGTSAGTAIVQHAYTGQENTQITNLTSVGNILFFKAAGLEDRTEAVWSRKNRFALWQTDGTPAGTQWVEVQGPGAQYAFDPAYVDGTLYIKASDDQGRCAVWKGDATEVGIILTERMLDTCPAELTISNGILFFVTLFAERGGPDCTLWASGGTQASAIELIRFASGEPDACPSQVFTINGRLSGRLFSINRRILIVIRTPRGHELWTSGSEHETNE